MEQKIDLKEIVNALWIAGRFSDTYLKSNQQKVLKFIEQTKDPFVDCSRRYGKTTTILNHCINVGNTRKVTIRWCEPWKNQCREIVMPEMEQIQNDIDTDHRWQWRQVDSYYEHKVTGARIFMRGLNEDNGESARGTKADIIVVDELGNIRNPKYIINEVLRPQLLTTNGKLIFTGTPPRDLTHAFYSMRDKAILQNRYIKQTIHDQQLVPWPQIEELVESMGGWSSPAVRRELLCEKVIDKNSAIIPEWNDGYIGELKRDEYFQFYFKYDSLDIGIRDLSVCVFAYYDFKQALLYIMDEVVMNGSDMTTEKLANAIKEKEKEVFLSHKPRKRVSDIDLLLVQDLSRLHDLYFDPTDKGGLEEMVNELRIWVNSGRILVHPKCEHVIGCFKYGIWDDNRKKWERSETLGHFDALAAVMYLVRNVDRKTNPIPFNYGISKDDVFLTGSEKKPRDIYRKMFNIRGRSVW